ncbi:MAG: hypothetical protein R3C20_09775 [Planctomycetaceae bacterium]
MWTNEDCRVIANTVGGPNLPLATATIRALMCELRPLFPYAMPQLQQICIGPRVLIKYGDKKLFPLRGLAYLCCLVNEASIVVGDAIRMESRDIVGIWRDSNGVERDLLRKCEDLLRNSP